MGQEDLPVPAVRSLVGPEMIIGLSTHLPEQAREARSLGADYIGVGPIFATNTKEDVVDPVGYEYLDWVARNGDLPFVAIGGIKRHNIAEVARHGARCCSLVSELVGAPDIRTRVEDVRKAMIGSRTKREQVYAALRKQGVPDAELAAVCCPIGLSIEAETPQQIAVSIVAELLAARAGTLVRLRFDD